MIELLLHVPTHTLTPYAMPHSFGLPAAPLHLSRLLKKNRPRQRRRGLTCTCEHQTHVREVEEAERAQMLAPPTLPMHVTNDRKSYLRCGSYNRDGDCCGSYNRVTVAISV
jgi:hypothetical protein